MKCTTYLGDCKASHMLRGLRTVHMKDGKQNWYCYTKRTLNQMGTYNVSPRGQKPHSIHFCITKCKRQ